MSPADVAERDSLLPPRTVGAEHLERGLEEVERLPVVLQLQVDVADVVEQAGPVSLPLFPQYPKPGQQVLEGALEVARRAEDQPQVVVHPGHTNAVPAGLRQMQGLDPVLERFLRLVRVKGALEQPAEGVHHYDLLSRVPCQPERAAEVCLGGCVLAGSDAEFTETQQETRQWRRVSVPVRQLRRAVGRRADTHRVLHGALLQLPYDRGKLLHFCTALLTRHRISGSC